MTEKRRMDNEKEPDENLIFGRNAVAELLKSGRTVDKVLIQRGQREGSITTIAATLDIPRQTAIGAPISSKTAKSPNKTAVTIVYSPFC